MSSALWEDFAINAADYIRFARVACDYEALYIKTIASLAAEVTDLLDMIEETGQFFKHRKELRELIDDMTIMSDQVSYHHDCIAICGLGLACIANWYIKHHDTIRGMKLVSEYSQPNTNFTIEPTSGRHTRRHVINKKTRTPKGLRQSKIRTQLKRDILYGY
jgi:hypothetical protein